MLASSVGLLALNTRLPHKSGSACLSMFQYYGVLGQVLQGKKVSLFDAKQWPRKTKKTHAFPSSQAQKHVLPSFFLHLSKLFQVDVLCLQYFLLQSICNSSMSRYEITKTPLQIQLVFSHHKLKTPCLEAFCTSRRKLCMCHVSLQFMCQNTALIACFFARSQHRQNGCDIAKTL